MAAVYVTIWVTLAWLCVSILLTVSICAVVSAHRRHEQERDRSRAAVKGHQLRQGAVGAGVR